MKIRSLLAIVTLLSFSLSAMAADIQPWKDYDISDAVWSVSTIKVHPNMNDDYLEGIIKTWVSGNEVAKKLGQIEEYSIFRSELPQSGDFNLMLVIKYAKGADMEPSKARYDAFMKAMGEKQSKEISEYSQKNYPAMREITGQYNFRKITIK